MVDRLLTQHYSNDSGSNLRNAEFLTRGYLQASLGTLRTVEIPIFESLQRPRF